MIEINHVIQGARAQAESPKQYTLMNKFRFDYSKLDATCSDPNRHCIYVAYTLVCPPLKTIYFNYAKRCVSALSTQYMYTSIVKLYSLRTGGLSS